MLSTHEVAALPADLKVELAYGLALITDAPLTARFRVEHWLLHPQEAEAAGNDWTVAEDCDLLTTQVTHVWSTLPVNVVLDCMRLHISPSLKSAQRKAYFSSIQKVAPTTLTPRPSNKSACTPGAQHPLTMRTTVRHDGALLTYLLTDGDLTPVLLYHLQGWPLLLSPSVLNTRSDLLSICTHTAESHHSWSRSTRLDRIRIWSVSSPSSAKYYSTQLIIDDCYTSMLTLTVNTARHLNSRYAGICKLSASAIRASIEASPTRKRVVLMCRAADSMPPALLSRLLYIHTHSLLRIWRVNTNYHIQSKSHMQPQVTDPCHPNGYSQNSTPHRIPSYAQPVVTYLAEERHALRTFFMDRIGTHHIHMYLASTRPVNLPRGSFNPCDKRYRRSDFMLRLPIKQKVGLDVAVGPLSKLLTDRPELSHVHICSRNPIAARLARTTLTKATHATSSIVKCSGWDNVPASSILFRPPHPSTNCKRATLVGPPTHEELAAEKEFEAACMGASLGGNTEKKYGFYLQQFTEHCHRCNAHLLVESNSQADPAEVLKNLRFWVRRFLLSEGGVRGLQYSSINGKAYAIRWHFLTSYGIDVLAGWVEHKIFMRGLKRIRHTHTRKIPVSWALLVWLVRQLDSSLRHLVIKAAILVGWWFLCRISEIISFRLGSIRFYNSSGSLMNIQTDNLADAIEVDLLFAVTKNDAAGDGAVRTHSKVQSSICVVSALADMIAARRTANHTNVELDLMAPLFQFFDDSSDSKAEHSISRATIVRVLKTAAAAASIPEARVSCHSLRSGGAVAMLSVSGCSYSDVRLFGRWRSDCARIYLRSVRGQMAGVSARMAANSSDCTVMLTGGTRQKRY